MLNLFRPGFVEILRCGGGGGGGGGGGSDSGSGSGGLSVTASSKGSSGGGGYTSFSDMFDGGGPGRSGSTFGGALGGISNAAGFSPAGSDGGGGFTSVGDMFDGGGPGASGGPYSGGPFSGIANAVTGQFTSVGDMFDGGGPGQSGPQFEGSLPGTAANALGLPPLGQGSGTVSNLLTGVTNATNFATGTPVMSSMMREEIRPVLTSMGLPSQPPAGAPVPATPTGPAPVSVGSAPPPIAMLGAEGVMANANAPLTFEQYLAQLPVASAPPPVMPLGLGPISDALGMPSMLSAPQVLAPQLAQFLAPQPMPAPASPASQPVPISGLTPFPGPTGADGRLLGTGIAALARPGFFNSFFG